MRHALSFVRKAVICCFALFAVAFSAEAAKKITIKTVPEFAMITIDGQEDCVLYSSISYADEEEGSMVTEDE